MPAVTLIIDMQVDFFRKQRLARLRPSLTASTNELVAAARKAGSPIIWVRQELAPDLSERGSADAAGRNDRSLKLSMVSMEEGNVAL